MNCKEARARWHQRLDENGNDPQLDEHMQVCEACRRYNEEMGLITMALGDLRQETQAIGSPAMSATHGSTIRGPWRTVIRSLGAVAAAVAVIVTGSVFYTSDPSTSPPVGSASPVAAIHLGLSLRGKTAAKFMAVSEPTSDPNVQVFRLYPRLTMNTDEEP